MLGGKEKVCIGETNNILSLEKRGGKRREFES